MQPFISVIIPTYNRRASLVRVLQALGRQTYPTTAFEVLVVDDGSTDGTRECLSDLDLAYTLTVLQQPNRGPGAARNLGVEHARGSVVLFLDDDVVPLPDLMAAHAAIHQAEPNSVVVGPMSPPPAAVPRAPWVRWEEAMLQLQYRAMLAGAYDCTPRQFYTGNASLPRARFLDVGGFDPGFKRAEDIELAFRLRDRGARFVFEPRADAQHYAERSFDAWRRTPYQYGHYDVVMHRTRGHESLECAVKAFHDRHPLNWLLARLCVGRTPLVEGAVAALYGFVCLADRMGANRPAAFALSAIFNLVYWHGVCEELGGAVPLWRSVAARAVVV